MHEKRVGKPVVVRDSRRQPLVNVAGRSRIRRDPERPGADLSLEPADLRLDAIADEDNRGRVIGPEAVSLLRNGWDPLH